MPRIIKFFETTLRDGEQTPGINYFAEEKLEIARALADMGFDTLDCGFAISGQPEFEAIRLIARTRAQRRDLLHRRCFPDDIDRAWEAVKDAEHSVDPPLHQHLAAAPGGQAGQDSRPRCWRWRAPRWRVAASYTENVDFALEDTTRTEHDFIWRWSGRL